MDGGQEYFANKPEWTDTKDGEVVCTKGIAQGAGFRLPENYEVVVGRNPQYVNLLVDSPKISNVHCTIRFNPGGNFYIVTDMSKNGTYADGKRLQKDAETKCKRGTVLSLAGDGDKIVLR